jgi:hypothetical protein
VEITEFKEKAVKELAALVCNVDWDKIHKFELDWKSLSCNEIDELVPVVKIEFTN